MLSIIKVVKKLLLTNQIWKKVANFYYLINDIFIYKINRKKNGLAIQITPVELKLMIMSKSSHRYSIDYYAVVSLLPETKSGNKISFSEQVQCALQSILLRTKPRVNFVITAMPDSRVIHKKILLDKTENTSVLDDLVEQSINQYLAYSIEDLSVDYVALGTSKSNPAKQEVLLVVSQCKHVAEQVDAIEQVGLTVKILDIESYAVARALTLISHQIPKDIFNNGVIAFIEISERLIKFNIFSQENVLYTKEELWVENSLVHCIVQLLELFYLATSYKKIDFLVLSGKDVLLLELTQLLHKELDVPVIIADPCVDFHMASKLNKNLLKENSSTLMVILGLAMRGLQYDKY